MTIPPYHKVLVEVQRTGFRGGPVPDLAKYDRGVLMQLRFLLRPGIGLFLPGNRSTLYPRVLVVLLRIFPREEYLKHRPLRRE